jgi:hypothetical protein
MPDTGLPHSSVMVDGGASINVRSAGPKVEPKKSLLMSAPLAEPVAFTKKSTRQMTPRTTSQPTNLFWVMIEPLGA